MSTKNNLPEDGFGREFIITREFDAPRELVFDAHSGENEDEPGQFVTTVTFDDQAGKMKLTLRALFRSAAERDEAVKKHNAIEGGNQTLNRLGEHLPRMVSAAPPG
jgi:uncharacterized protein YndB with AHSA1/START domain